MCHEPTAAVWTASRAAGHITYVRYTVSMSIRRLDARNTARGQEPPYSLYSARLVRPRASQCPPSARCTRASSPSASWRATPPAAHAASTSGRCVAAHCAMLSARGASHGASQRVRSWRGLWCRGARDPLARTMRRDAAQRRPRHARWSACGAPAFPGRSRWASARASCTLPARRRAARRARSSRPIR